MDQWHPIPGLTSRAQAVYRQNWEMLCWLQENPDATQLDREAILDTVIGLETKLKFLSDGQKYTSQPGRIERKLNTQGGP